MLRAIIDRIKRFFSGAVGTPAERYAIYISGATAICPVCSGYVKVKDDETIECHDCGTRYRCVGQGVNPRSLVYEVEGSGR